MVICKIDKNSPYSLLITRLQNEIEAQQKRIEMLETMLIGEAKNDDTIDNEIIQTQAIKTKSFEKEYLREKRRAEIYRKEISSLSARLKKEIEDREKDKERHEREIESKHRKQPKTAFERAFEEIRPTVLERDNYKCVDCGGDKYLHVHHKVHRKHGGTNSTENLETLCKWCHAERHKGEPVYNIMRKALL